MAKSLLSKINKKNKAQLFTLDVLLALVPLVIIIAVSANAFTGVASQMQTYISTYSMQRATDNAADTLIKTPGIPKNWEFYDSSNITMIGMAAWIEATNAIIPNYIDMWKYSILNTTNPKNNNKTFLEEMIGTSRFNVSMKVHNLSAYNLSGFTVPSYGSSVPANASEIFVSERIAIADNLLAITASSPYALAINNTGGGQNSRCFLSEFALSQADIDNTNYWIFINFTGTPSFGFSINEHGGADEVCRNGAPNCNTILDTNNFPGPNFDGGGSFPGYTWDNQRSCSGADKNITYYVKNYTNRYEIWASVPSSWLVTGYQEFYLWVSGYTSIETGWYATAPTWVTREQLEQYFRSTIPLDDVPVKITLKVWR